ncbi:Microtubule-associated protein RP/EB family member 1C [Tritrichomonas foetus]|uniref:Microtubule-associated protein RP/EB family member 1C n=1 Tax=Tritrichomonas foetus TaxID=1144522 RepID=A0A1J4KB02_9EUKA|nr:Microtubule-associated protein RP/EB family member 1C [Tritrichomonas foetus]|eukprot:OHT08395.1 Microtubule-associated protein RP/EB family member 1C [Tritrichomonas foetus]
MMSGCYFIGRAELLEWVNELLQLDYNKVEDTSNGAAFCQIIDSIHPGTVALGRVNYNAVSESEMVENYKILQDAFDKNGITQYMDVPTLIKGRYMAALELFQWIHGYYEQVGGNPDYDAVARRKQTRCKEPNARGRINKKPAGMAKRAGGIPLEPSSKNAKGRIGGIPNGSQAKGPNKAEKGNEQNIPAASKKPLPKSKVTKEEPKPKTTKQAKTTDKEENNSKNKEQGDSSKVKELNSKIAELHEEIQQMNQERDFYYEKLRRIEDFCQENEEIDIIGQVLSILYEADEEKGFMPPEDEEDEDD